VSSESDPVSDGVQQDEAAHQPAGHHLQLDESGVGLQHRHPESGGAGGTKRLLWKW